MSTLHQRLRHNFWATVALMARIAARYRPQRTDEFRGRWDLIDPALSDEKLARVAKALVELAMTEWTADVVVDFDDRATQAFLARHRVTTSLPLRCVKGEEQRNELRTRLHTIYGVQMRIETTARVVIDELREIGIDARVLKGLASAQLDYPHPELRQTGDVDLAIPAGTVEAAYNHLKQRGYLDYAHAPASTHLLKGVTLRAANGIEVDLHDRLFQRSPMTSALFDELGQQVPNLGTQALNVNFRLVHAAGHFILAPPGTRRMSGFLDTVVLRNNPDVDLTLTLAIAERLGIARLVGSSLRLEAALSGRNDHDLQAWPAADWLERRTRLQTERNLTLDQLSRFREVPRSRWLTYLPYWIVPEARRRKLFKRRALEQWRRLTGTQRR